MAERRKHGRRYHKSANLWNPYSVRKRDESDDDLLVKAQRTAGQDIIDDSDYELFADGSEVYIPSPDRTASTSQSLSDYCNSTSISVVSTSDSIEILPNKNSSKKYTTAKKTKSKSPGKKGKKKKKDLADLPLYTREEIRKLDSVRGMNIFLFSKICQKEIYIISSIYIYMY